MKNVSRFAAALLLVAGFSSTAAAQPVSDAAVSEALRQRLDEMQTTSRLAVGRAEVAARTALPILYEEAGYAALWNAERLETLLALVKESADDGLSPEDYHASELARLAPSLAAPRDAISRAQLDLLATDAFYLLLSHLYLGKVDPTTLDPKWNFEPPPVGDRAGAAFVLDAITSGKLREAVARVRPSHWWYARARAALTEYRALAAKGGWAPIPAGPALKPGSSGPRVVALRRRLAATGDLAGQPLDAPAFDEPVAAAVRAFQTRHRISPEGVVGPATLAELNVPVGERIRQIRVNLERGRWLLHDAADEDFVLVDVAGFEAAYMRNHAAVWRARVQVGKPYRQTPIFRSKIDHVVFNPTWTIPPGIAAKDTVPAIKKDRGYLAKKGLDVLDAEGRKVDPSTIDWAAMKGSGAPYMFRQPAGPDNALGRVKIMFPNPYFVYLHDTPSQELFEKDERTFSSGCMRLQRPLELAELVLNDPENWNAASIASAVAAGETKTVRLKTPVPVLILYWTIDLSTEGRIVFKKDPYERDPKLAAALESPPPKS
jgi:murein L,D-transpeptidase YcbB/YkuD